METTGYDRGVSQYRSIVDQEEEDETINSGKSKLKQNRIQQKSA